MPAGAYQFFDLKPSPADMLAEVVAGLSQTPKRIAPKYFYDERGSRLFEAITRLPEYYLTRTEMSLFDACLPQVRDRIGEGCCLVEYGAGASVKIRRLLEVLRPTVYVPLDISRDHLERTASTLHRDYPSLHVYPTCADITAPLDLPEIVTGQEKLGFFPGSSIGNFEPEQAETFLRQAAGTLGGEARLLVGVDRRKDSKVLEAAYNDAAGATAAFNLNILTHLNVALGANFDPAAFRHQAAYNQQAGCIQMHLQSLKRQSLRIAGRKIDFQAGELVHTENSYKYDHSQFARLAERSGFEVEANWSDANTYFTVFLLRG